MKEHAETAIEQAAEPEVPKVKKGTKAAKAKPTGTDPEKKKKKRRRNRDKPRFTLSKGYVRSLVDENARVSKGAYSQYVRAHDLFMDGLMREGILATATSQTQTVKPQHVMAASKNLAGTYGVDLCTDVYMAMVKENTKLEREDAKAKKEKERKKKEETENGV